ncbi:alpha/beta hydrolase [Planococcus sp. CP5-4]|uniref:alpha/beta hydrolase n=1 Tax=unclassified Planococcus (in: firmicutes) TaxID=2662419 RepID=UPI001C222130|nr:MULTISPECIES: alpha/beta hydrolase [unclassified Planococcus (in: firmicutes)]MBU9674940.1 alpha/beta hydrolase [Planococcus sp. CP5-4_YE]MBV0908403.1 alpha/beta hydrolase [Planococcus sp. CP5-4_UN]MBW6062617.1 alpha/beta hydrolase [Planococcus sp. CP5-4]
MKKWTAALLALAGILLANGCSADNDEDTAESEAASNIDGFWQGAIEVPGQPIPFSIEITGDEGTLSIPLQGVENYPLSTIKFDDPEVAFDTTIQGERLVFEGALESQTITGNMTQQNQKFPFELERGEKEQAVDPEKIIETEVEGGMMQALEEIPATDGPHPVAILIAGSGPTDKDGNSLTLTGKNNSLKMLAEELKAEGIAVIRYDKRGIGDNAALAKNESELRFDDYAEDAAAWIRFAKEDERFSDVAVIGHSEGALVGLVAANQQGVDSYVSLTGVGRTADELLREQLSTLPAAQQKEADAILEQLAQGTTVDDVSPELQQIFRPSVQPYLQSWMAYDPIEQVKKLDAEALFVGGTRDLQVPVRDAELLHEAKSGSELLIVDGMNHVLKSVPDDQQANMAAYSDPELPLADGLVDRIAEFLKN